MQWRVPDNQDFSTLRIQLGNDDDRSAVERVGCGPLFHGSCMILLPKDVKWLGILRDCVGLCYQSPSTDVFFESYVEID